ncbi:hypothetical protein C4556_00900 [Candidatus Parcubacteria bacterium]|nr:MAG: hypothetical protein C4556_00900 [Candidatus Parcubacteria bacterium]
MGTRIHKISRYKPSIFQGSLRLSTERGGFSLTVEHPAERVLFKTLIAALALLTVGYVYFVSASVLNVIARKDAVRETASLESKVSLLERDYYAATAALTPSSGERLGLSPVSNTRYVHRPGVVGVAETPLNEI